MGQQCRGRPNERHESVLDVVLPLKGAAQRAAESLRAYLRARERFEGQLQAGRALTSLVLSDRDTVASEGLLKTLDDWHGHPERIATVVNALHSVALHAGYLADE